MTETNTDPKKNSETLFKLGHSLFCEATQWMKARAPQTTAEIEDTFKQWRNDKKEQKPLTMKEVYESVSHQSLNQLKNTGLFWANSLQEELSNSKRESGHHRRKKRKSSAINK